VKPAGLDSRRGHDVTTVGRVTVVMVGSEETRLVVLRGNSASGKSSVAAGLREKFGRGLALVAQDNLRRVVLREHDLDRYGDMLSGLRADHRGQTHYYYLDVPFDETLARHATKPIAEEVNETQLRDQLRLHSISSGGLAKKSAQSPAQPPAPNS
jgi:chloramphenicol 3-O-phosphotransferase